MSNAMGEGREGEGNEMKTTIVLAVWVALGTLNYAALCATFDYECQGRYSAICDSRHARQNMGFAAFFSIVPVWWFMTPVITGFYQDGFRMTVRATRADRT